MPAGARGGPVLRVALMGLALALATPAAAQDGAGPVAPGGALAEGAVEGTVAEVGSAVVVLDRDVLYASSLFGRRVARDIETASETLSEENTRIEGELEAEEEALTERRAETDTETFRELATAFDEKVTGIRRAQDAKARAIAQQGERAQTLFFEAANPVLVELARDTGALVILDRRIVIASANQVDITQAALQRIDAAIGEGDAVVNRAPEPRPERDPSPVAEPDRGSEPAAAD